MLPDHAEVDKRLVEVCNRIRVRMRDDATTKSSVEERLRPQSEDGGRRNHQSSEIN